MRRVLAPLLLSLVAPRCLAQGTTVRLDFGSEGEREVYVAKPGDLDSATAVTSPTEKSAEIKVTEGKDLLVVVLDRGSGVCVARSASAVLKDKSWKLGTKDEKRAATVEVVVTYGRRTLDEGFVRLETKGEVRERLLSVADKGKASFRFVPTGEGTVTVRYRGSDGKDATETKKISVVDGPDAAAFTVSLAKAAASSPEDPSLPPPRAPEQSMGSRIAGILVGLGVIGAALWGIMFFLKKNREQVEKALTSAGIVPVDTGTDTDTAASAVPEPRKKIEIVMDDPGPASAPAAPPATTHVPNPRLVAIDGSVHLLAGEEKSVGRDEGADIALASESSVSRTHAKLVPSGDGYALEDLGSSNGTYVNGSKISAPTQLRRGDIVQFAGARFTYEE
ncbi:MAG: FHA domain-containing protein [Fimbriimonadaceae bacterium]